MNASASTIYWYGQLVGHQPLVVYLCVSEWVSVSADMSPYCSAHDEWLIMKLCMYVGYSSTPFIRPPSESHWCGRIRGMVATRSWGIRIQTESTVRHTKCGRMRGMVVGEGGRSTGGLLYHDANNVSNFGGDPVNQLNFKNVLKLFYAVLRARCTIAVTRPLVLRLLLRNHSQAAGVWKTVAPHTSLSAALVIMLFKRTLCCSFVISAVSPAVVVPCLLSLSERGYGVDKGIPTLVIAASSIDDVLAISGFGILLGISFSEGE